MKVFQIEDSAGRIKIQFLESEAAAREYHRLNGGTLVIYEVAKLEEVERIKDTVN